MAYLCTKKVGKNRYYIIRESFRKDGKICTRDLSYLGKNLSGKTIKGELKKYSLIKKSFIRKIYIEYARKNQQKEDKYFNENQILEIKSVLNSYNRSKHKNKIFQNLQLEFIAQNISMEPSRIGNLSIKEIKKIARSKEFSGKKTLAQINCITNTEKILHYLQKKKPILSLGLIIQIYETLLNEIAREKGFRIKEIKIQNSPLKPSKKDEIKKDLRKLFSWYNSENNKIHPLALAILFHHKFEKIHPFMDMNGEVGRIISNYLLEKKGYPPLIISAKTKSEYLRSMNKAYPCLKKDLLNTDMKYYSELINFMHNQFIRNYWRNFTVK